MLHRKGSTVSNNTTDGTNNITKEKTLQQSQNATALDILHSSTV